MCGMVRFWTKSGPKTTPLLPFPFYPLFFFSKAPKSINRKTYLMYSQVEWRVKLLYKNCVRVCEHCLPKPMSYFVRNWELSSGGIHIYLRANHQYKCRVSSSQFHLLSFLIFHLLLPLSFHDIHQHVLIWFPLIPFDHFQCFCSPSVC